MANSTNYMLTKMHPFKSAVDVSANQSVPQNKTNEIKEIPVPELAPTAELSLGNVVKNCLSNKDEKKLLPGS
ncbi:Uncharacterised protein [Legionella lansingensis]|uniref:Uncharacterized protein n=1 Tax=Legionella lansingensis TaxID=45067 RepID=A0A0W0VH18_9GAMM|nr:hypothetical protein [Legionella lansingensis]KTD19370.1 hypothetical protein Llan_2108 [Legionella lansingensis]SNV53433.1 Uncharacterised protein [Legionella lansingensis]